MCSISPTLSHSHLQLSGLHPPLNSMNNLTPHYGLVNSTGSGQPFMGGWDSNTPVYHSPPDARVSHLDQQRSEPLGLTGSRPSHTHRPNPRNRPGSASPPLQETTGDEQIGTETRFSTPTDLILTLRQDHATLSKPTPTNPLRPPRLP